MLGGGGGGGGTVMIGQYRYSLAWPTIGGGAVACRPWSVMVNNSPVRKVA